MKFRKDSIMLFLVMCFLMVGHSQAQDNSLVIGNIDSIYSSILNEKRAVWVHVPSTTTSTIFSAQDRYPVIYLLDGDAHFYSVVGLMHQLSQVNGNTICPEMMVVGIPNTDRTRDLTPTHSDFGLDGDSTFVKTSGGGENFTAFIEKELIPYIDSLYPTAPYRMLIGHSFGGLLVVNTLLNHNNLFNSYLAIDPSLWWDNKILLKQLNEELKNINLNNKRLFLAIANTMPSQMDTFFVNKDTSWTTEHIRTILQFSSIIKSKTNNGLLFSNKYYEQDDHGSVPLIATYDALHFFFDFYKLPVDEKLLDSLINTDSLLVSHFSKISSHMGYKVLPNESLINTLGYYFLGNKMFSKAFPLFETNIKNYPNSFNVYDSMGDYYAALNNNEMAIELYEKALSLREFPETKIKLEKLKSLK